MLVVLTLTLTLTGLAADSQWAGGEGPRPGRRLVSVLAMLVGAAIGGVLVLSGSVAAALGLAAALLLFIGIAAYVMSSSSLSWVAPG